MKLHEFTIEDTEGLEMSTIFAMAQHEVEEKNPNWATCLIKLVSSGSRNDGHEVFIYNFEVHNG